MDEADGFVRLTTMNSGCDGTFFGAHFATVLVAMLKDVIGAKVPQHIDAVVTGNFLRAITPENNSLV